MNISKAHTNTNAVGMSMGTHTHMGSQQLALLYFMFTNALNFFTCVCVCVCVWCVCMCVCARVRMCAIEQITQTFDVQIVWSRKHNNNKSHLLILNSLTNMETALSVYFSTFCVTTDLVISTHRELSTK